MSKEKLKLIGGGLVVLAAASIMFQPLFAYIAGIGRLITFIVTMLLLAYLFTYVVRKMKGKYNTTNGADPSYRATETTVDVGDPED